MIRLIVGFATFLTEALSRWPGIRNSRYSQVPSRVSVPTSSCFIRRSGEFGRNAPPTGVEPHQSDAWKKNEPRRHEWEAEAL
jgi:hypothetical protein